MKALALAMAGGALIACTSPAASSPLDIEDRLAIIDTITAIAAGADRHQWNRVRAAFADEVRLDYTSLWGGAPTTQPADEVVAQWAAFLPGFEATVHLVSNHTIVSATPLAAVAEADFQALHTLEGDMWALYGRYRYELEKTDGAWKISGLTMTRTAEIGDRALVGRAQTRAGEAR